VFSMSVLDFVHLGSSLSLRSFARVGSAVSVRGLSKFGSAMSVLDFLQLGSSLSLRSFARVGSSVSINGISRFGSVFSMSVLDFVHLGSSLSLRSFARVGSSLSITTALVMGSADIYYRTNKALTLSSTGGNLEGVWSSDNVISLSDRRLKKDIIPLEQTIHAEMEKSRPHSSRVSDAQTQGSAGSSDAISWILRELRPVSFSFRRGPESKYARYGFVAQELGRTLPALSREKDGYHHVQYQDMIALLTLTAKHQQERLDSLAETVEALVQTVSLERQHRQSLEELVATYTARTDILEKLVATLQSERSPAVIT